ncbi:hypothetical protein NIES3585_48110 [Nodularia sp. NIES-3585]|nr:hypothetical protein NIES3585_48110 [Nodularia sp. NIES-3585]
MPLKTGSASCLMNRVTIATREVFWLFSEVKGIVSASLAQLIHTLLANQSCTYIFPANTQILDQILVSSNLHQQAKGAVVHSIVNLPKLSRGLVIMTLFLPLLMLLNLLCLKFN